MTVTTIAVVALTLILSAVIMLHLQNFTDTFRSFRALRAQNARRDSLIVRAYEQGKSDDEIGRMLGMSARAVARRRERQ